MTEVLSIEDVAPVGFVCDDRMLLHAGPTKHPECPGRYTSMKEKLEQYMHLLTIIPSREATKEEITMVHDPDHVDRVFGFEKHLGDELDVDSCDEPSSEEENFVVMPKKKPTYTFAFGADTYVCKDTPRAARLSAGCLLNLCDGIMDPNTEYSRGFALIRPPGHHANADTASGFCLFNNVAIAARYLQNKYGLTRIMILDWDVHHGNGTNDIFQEDKDVLFVSIHRHDNGHFYPGEGAAEDIGSGEGEGYCINVPLDKGYGDV
jgi:acetoin utilization deacetylase AcuC-like enzyme